MTHLIVAALAYALGWATAAYTFAVVVEEQDYPDDPPEPRRALSARLVGIHIEATTDESGRLRS